MIRPPTQAPPKHANLHAGTALSGSPASAHPPNHPSPPQTPDPNPQTLPPSLLDQLTDPSLSLRDIAAAHNITLQGLSLLLARPDIQQQIEALESITARRARHIAATFLPAAAAALNRIITAPPPVLPGEVSRGLASDGGGASAPPASPPDEPEAPARITTPSAQETHSSRAASGAEEHRTAPGITLRAANLLFRIACFQAGPPVRHPSRPSSPKTQGQQTLGPIATRAGTSPAPTLDQLLSQIHEIAPTLLSPSAPPHTNGALPSLRELSRNRKSAERTLRALTDHLNHARSLHSEATPSPPADDTHQSPPAPPPAPPREPPEPHSIPPLSELFDLFPELSDDEPDPFADVPDDILIPAAIQIGTALSQGQSVESTPGDPVDILHSFLASAPTRAGPAP